MFSATRDKTIRFVPIPEPPLTSQIIAASSPSGTPDGNSEPVTTGDSPLTFIPTINREIFRQGNVFSMVPMGIRVSEVVPVSISFTAQTARLVGGGIRSQLRFVPDGGGMPIDIDPQITQVNQRLMVSGIHTFTPSGPGVFEVVFSTAVSAGLGSATATMFARVS